MSKRDTDEFDRDFETLLHGHQWDPERVRSTGLVPSTTTMRLIPPCFQPLYRKELYHLQLLVKKSANLGQDIFKHILNFLSDFDLVEYEAYWEQDGISNLAGELLNKRVGCDDGINLLLSDSE